MASDKSRNQHQGFLLPDPRLREPSCIWDAQSSYTQAGPQAGVPAAVYDSELVLEASGNQPAGSQVEILSIHGGMPGRSDRGGGFAWKKEADPSTNYRGHEPPGTISGWETVRWNSGSGSFENPHAVTTITDRVVVAYEWGNGIYVHHRDPDTGAWAGPVTVHLSTDGNAYRPCLLEVGERLYCIYAVQGPVTSSDDYYLRVSVSEDDGLTWGVARRFASDVIMRPPGHGTGPELRRLRAAYKDGQVIVIAHIRSNGAGVATWIDRLWQFASSDLSMRLDAVETPSNLDADVEGAYPEIVVVDDSFVVAYLVPSSGPGDINWKRVASAYQPLSTATTELPSGTWASVTVTTTTVGNDSYATDGDLALVVDDSEVVWGYIRDPASGSSETQRCEVFYSDDGMTTLSEYGIDPANTSSLVDTGVWHRAEDTTGVHPEAMTATYQRGRVVLVHNWQTVASPATSYEGSLGAFYLGGYSTLVLPQTRSATAFPYRAQYSHALCPVVRGQDSTIWTGTSAGTNSNAVQNGHEYFSSGSGGGTNGQVYNTATDSQTGDIAWMGAWSCYAYNGADTSSDEVCVRWRIDDGSQGFEVSIRMSATAILAYDTVAASTLFNVTGLTDGGRDYRLGMYVTEDGVTKTVRLYYRDHDHSEDREWKLAGTASLSDDGGTVGSNRVQYGHVANSGATTQIESEWYLPPVWSIDDIGGSIHSTVGSVNWWHSWDIANDNPTELTGRAFSPHPVYVADGVRLRALDGPAMRGNEHHIATRYEFPIDRLWPSVSRSPRSPWRSTDTSQQTIALALDAVTTQEHEPLSPIWGVGIYNTNVRTGSIQRYDVGTTSWVTEVSFDAAEGLTGLAATRTGNTLSPNGAHSVVFPRHELGGWIAHYDSNVYRVTSSSPGQWDNTISGPQARVILEGATGAAASGTVAFSPPSFVVVWHPTDTSAAYRVVIDSQSTPENYFEIGAMVPGPIHIVGQPYDWGRGYSLSPGHIREEMQDRTSHTRQTAPPRRAADLTWANVDTSNAHDADLDYILTSSTGGTEGAASPSLTVYDLFGLLDDIRGEPVVYLPNLPQGTPDSFVLNRWHEHMYCSAEGELDSGGILGEEWESEVMRAKLSLVEEV